MIKKSKFIRQEIQEGYFLQFWLDKKDLKRDKVVKYVWKLKIKNFHTKDLMSLKNDENCYSP